MSSGWLQWLMVAAGGAAGGALRFAVSGWVDRRIGETFPWGTLIVNVSGACLLGVLAGRLAIGSAATDDIWLVLGVGMIGSYTTVSSLSLQTLLLLKDRQVLRAFAYVGLSLFAGLAAGALGLWLGRQ
jgi:fluoride exporter